MKRLSIVAVCALLAASLAAPAMAKDHSVGGFLQTKAIMANVNLEDDAQPDKFIDQRFRAKWDINLNEYVSVTYYGEVDIQYGDSAYEVQDGGRGRNGGGAIGGDQANIETKHLYMNVKIPETPASFRLGLQGFAAPDYALWLFDAAGLTLNFKAEMFAAQFGYAKLIEGDTSNGRVENPGAISGENDTDFIYLKGSATPMEALEVGAGLYWVRNQADSARANNPANFASNTYDFDGDGTAAGNTSIGSYDFNLYYLILDGAFKMDLVTVDGWVATGFGKIEDIGGEDVDMTGFAATVKASGKIDGIGWGARLLYWSDAGDDSDEYTGLYTPFADAAVKEVLPFATDGLMLMVSDITTTTYGSRFRGFAMESAYTGYGLMGVTVNGSFSPPAMKNAYVKGAVGYFNAVDEDNGLGGSREGDTIGTEVAARVGYVLADAVDLSINGAYAFLGDFYDNQASNNPGEDPDDPYMLYLMAKVGF